MNRKYEGSIPIWGKQIPGNTGKSKLDDIHPDDSLSTQDIFEKYPGIWDRTSDQLGDMRGNDTSVWRDEIQNGYAETTYSDVPFLIPKLVSGSKRCVIVCPGGAYLGKSIKSEGLDVAAFLNEAGISAFVLWYRSYPYRAPYMFLDLQRAIRFVRFHADEYGIDKDKIATVGFSAGGNLCGVESFCFGNAPVSISGYEMDEVDKEDGKPNGAGLIYPAIRLENDKIIAVLAGKDAYNDPVKRNEAVKKYEMIDYVKKGDAPVFLCNSMDDALLPPMYLADLAAKCHENGISTELHIFPYGGHGFGGCIPDPANPFVQFDFSAVIQWKGLFTSWLKRTLN